MVVSSGEILVRGGRRPGAGRRAKDLTVVWTAGGRTRLRYRSLKVLMVQRSSPHWSPHVTGASRRRRSAGGQSTEARCANPVAARVAVSKSMVLRVIMTLRLDRAV